MAHDEEWRAVVDRATRQAENLLLSLRNGTSKDIEGDIMRLHTTHPAMLKAIGTSKEELDRLASNKWEV